MYKVPLTIPQYCNNCPFGQRAYHATTDGGTSAIDGEENKAGTYGYICHLDYAENGKYTKIARGSASNHIDKPDWCGLEEC